MDGQCFELGNCPLCHSLTFNGRCENRDCHHHFHPHKMWYEEDDEDEDD
ncbi:MAG: hypothetical protein R3Y63_13105 [Eubacteriales bacterium]